MRIALVADFHGNRPATEALETDLIKQKTDRIICLGDVVGKGPSSDYTCDWAFANCDVLIGGNWDYGIGQKLYAPDGFYWEQLGKKRLERLASLPPEYEMTLSNRRIRLFHGRPVMEKLIIAHQEKEAIEPFFLDASGKRYDVVGYADAHRQSLRTMSPGIFFNTGSVGNALGVPKCCYALMEGTTDGSDDFEIRFRQIDYDRAQAVADAEKTTEIAHIDCYINEIQTGVYSRHMIAAPKALRHTDLNLL